MNSTPSSNLHILSIRQVVSNLQFYGTISIAFPGLILNFLNLLMFRRKAFTKSLKFFYTSQSLSDIFAIIVSICVFFPMAFNTDWTVRSHFLCKFTWFFRRFSVQLSSWFQVIISIDRIFNILYDAKYKTILGKKYLWLNVIAILIFLAIGNIGNLFYYRQDNTSIVNNQTLISFSCSLTREAGFYVNLVGASLRAIIPFILMFSFNIIYGV
jgi:hypothetical protein